MSRSLPVRILGTAALLTACGCASAPKPRLIDETVALSVPYDEVWTGVIETLAEMSMPIDTREKESGLVTTDWMTFTGTGNDEVCDCGGLGLAIERSRKGKLDVRLTRDEATGETSVTVNTTYRQTRARGDAMSTVDCVSTGSVEKKLHATLRDIVGEAHSPDPRP